MMVSCGVYFNGLRRRERLTLADAVPAVAAEGGFIWVDLQQPSVEDLIEVTELLGLPVAVVQASARTHARPDLQDHINLADIALKAIRYVDPDKIADFSDFCPAGVNFRRHDSAGRRLRCVEGAGAARRQPA